ncbi:hypothetical protein GCM10022399_20020 [Terrabacter ginsenosidimutans]|uniref:Uncharacterized protein n=1 Tax=Terrabacter ginsenosidimutans TaxID=490575 RepID=A0ABP7DBH1_9MICO
MTENPFAFELDYRPITGNRRGFTSHAGDWRRNHLVSRKPVHCETDRAAEAWQSVLEADNVLAAAESELAVLPADRDEEARDVATADLAAVRAGKSLPKSKATDWDAEERRRHAVVALRREELATARNSYEVVAAEEAPKRADAARERLTVARSGLTAAAPALLEALAEFRAAKAAAEALAEELDPQLTEWVSVTRRDPDMSKAQRELDAAGPAIRRALGEDAHPALTGEVYLEDRGDVVPPLWWRESVHRHGSEHDAMRLAEIEAAERYRVTSYERELGERYFPQPPA